MLSEGLNISWGDLEDDIFTARKHFIVQLKSKHFIEVLRGLLKPVKYTCFLTAELEKNESYIIYTQV